MRWELKCEAIRVDEEKYTQLFVMVISASHRLLPQQGWTPVIYPFQVASECFSLPTYKISV